LGVRKEKTAGNKARVFRKHSGEERKDTLREKGGPGILLEGDQLRTRGKRSVREKNQQKTLGKISEVRGGFLPRLAAGVYLQGARLWKP